MRGHAHVQMKHMSVPREELTLPQLHHPLDEAGRRRRTWQIRDTQPPQWGCEWCWIIFAVFMHSPLDSARCRAAKVHTTTCSRQKNVPAPQRDDGPGNGIKERAGTHRHRHTELSGSTTGSTETSSDHDKPMQVRDFVELRCREWKRGSEPAPCIPWTGEPALNCTDLLLQIGISIVISASCLCDMQTSFSTGFLEEITPFVSPGLS